MKKLIFILPMLFAFVSTQGQGAMFLRGSQPAPQPGAGILDSYPGAAFAAAPDVLIYSSHSVTDNTVGSQTQGQTGPYTVLVRRDNDDALRSFTYTEVSDGTLTTWVGPANNGFVQILYDQGTNGNHATQTAAANQPKIVDAGVLVVENGKAALYFDGVNDYLILTSLILQEPMTFFFAFLRGAGSSRQDLTSSFESGITSNLVFLPNQNSFDMFNGTVLASSNVNTTTFCLAACVFNDISSGAWVNAVSVSSGATGTRIATNEQIIGADQNGIANNLNGRISAIIMYESDQSANRAAIETAINNEYTIY